LPNAVVPVALTAQAAETPPRKVLLEITGTPSIEIEHYPFQYGDPAEKWMLAAELFAGFESTLPRLDLALSEIQF
jgi:hypothetical protein